MNGFVSLMLSLIFLITIDDINCPYKLDRTRNKKYGAIFDMPETSVLSV